MKKSFFLLIVLYTLSLPTTKSLVPVRDTDRKPLVSGTSYYMLPVTRGKGGGVTLAPGRDEPCPYDVAQENNEARNGSPMKFAPANATKGGIIHESTDLNVIFTNKATCVETAVWRVEGLGAERIVSSHAIIGSPGRETVRNWFKIEKYEDYYKLVYCPTVCDCRPYCADIGSTIAKNGRRTLVLNNVPLKVKFKKA